MSKRKLTRRAALACLGSGAAGVLLGGKAFDSVAAGRDVTVDVSEDLSTALLGVSPANDVVVDNNGSTTIAEIANGFDEPLTDVSAEIIAIDGVNNSALQISPIDEIDNTVSLNASCSSEIDSNGTVPVTVQLTASGQSVGVSGVTFDVPIDIQCQPVVFGVSGSLSQSGNSGKVSFQLQTDRDIQATITGFSVRTKNDLYSATFTDKGTSFGGNSPPASFNGSIDCTLSKFQTSGNNKIQIENTDFIDPESPEADIELTLSFESYNDIVLGIDASLSSPGNSGGGGSPPGRGN